MAFVDKKDCSYQESDFPNGSEICVEYDCMLCDDGQWMEDIEEKARKDQAIGRKK